MVESVVQSHAEIVVDSTEKSKIRVLHVDDEPALLKAAKQCLEMQGPFRVDTASSVEEALVKLEKERYDAVVSDYRMPGKDGLDFLKELRESGNNVPFIMFTGKGREEVAIRALNLGANQYLNKTGETETVYTELAHTITELAKTKKAEELLRLSEERYRNLFENAKDVIILFDLKGNVTSANKGAEKYGFNRSGMLGKNMLKFVSKRYWPKLLKDVAQIALGKTAEGRIEIHTPKGDKIAGYRSNPIFSDNRIVGIQTILEDTTEHEKTEEDLRESEGRYNALIESINDVFFAIDRDFRYTYWNKASERLTGISAKDAIGKSLTEVFPDVEGTEVEQFYQNTLRTNQHQTFVNKYRMGDRDSVFEIDAYPTKDGLSVFVKDISERKKTEETLRESEEKYRNLFESAMDAIVTLDLKGSITAVNSSVLRFGYEKEDLVGKNILDFVSKEYWPAVMRDFSKVAQGEPAKNEVELVVPVGKILVEYHAGAVVKENNVAGVQINIRDVTERKKSEELLRESEERFRDLFESIQDPVGIFVGKEGHLIEYNAAFKKSSGYADEELKGKVFLDFVHPDDRAMVLEKYQTKYSEEELPLVYEIRGVNKKGESVPLELSVSTYKQKGKVIGIEVIHRNITERKKAEEALRETKEYLDNLLNYANAPVIVWDNEQKISLFNNAFEALTGYEKKSMLGRNIDVLFPPLQKTEILQTIERATRGEKWQSVEVPILCKDEETRIALWNSANIQDKDGNIVATIAQGQDITERKALEDALQDAKQKWTSLTENTDDIVMIVDSEGIIQYINRTIPPYTPEETIGKTVYEYVPREQHDTLRSSLKKTFEMGVPLSYVVSSNIPKIGTIWFETKIVPVKDDEKTVSAILMSTDITELKNTEERLKETNMKLVVTNEKLHVVGGLTRHDVRNKLSAVTGNAYLLRQKLVGDAKALEQLKDMEAAVRLVEKIFEFARIYEKLGTEQLVNTEVGKVVGEAASLFSDLKGVKIVNECDGLTVLADSLLKQLFYNLIDNSLKYGGKTGQIRAYYKERSADHLELVYEDDGVGIHDNMRSSLFKEGFTSGKGTGYGLFMIKRICEVYGWTIDETGVPGKGAQFTIDIPKAKPDGRQNYRLS